MMHSSCPKLLNLLIGILHTGFFQLNDYNIWHNAYGTVLTKEQLKDINCCWTAEVLEPVAGN